MKNWKNNLIIHVFGVILLLIINNKINVNKDNNNLYKYGSERNIYRNI